MRTNLSKTPLRLMMLSSADRLQSQTKALGRESGATKRTNTTWIIHLLRSVCRRIQSRPIILLTLLDRQLTCPRTTFPQAQRKRLCHRRAWTRVALRILPSNTQHRWVHRTGVQHPQKRYRNSDHEASRHGRSSIVCTTRIEPRSNVNICSNVSTIMCDGQGCNKQFNTRRQYK